MKCAIVGYVGVVEQYQEVNPPTRIIVALLNQQSQDEPTCYHYHLSRNEHANHNINAVPIETRTRDTIYPVVMVPSALTRIETPANGPFPGPWMRLNPLAGSKTAPWAGQTSF